MVLSGRIPPRSNKQTKGCPRFENDSGREFKLEKPPEPNFNTISHHQLSRNLKVSLINSREKKCMVDLSKMHCKSAE